MSLTDKYETEGVKILPAPATSESQRKNKHMHYTKLDGVYSPVKQWEKPESHKGERLFLIIGGWMIFTLLSCLALLTS